jgi:predicted enzyme related to lactoylglutathione lyase
MYPVINLARAKNFYENVLEISMNTMSGLRLSIIYLKVFVFALTSIAKEMSPSCDFKY